MIYSEFFIEEDTKCSSNEAELKQRCCKCILPYNYKFAEFGVEKSDRTCKYCREFEAKELLGIDQFVKDINLGDKERIGVTVSGGKDSIFAWNLLTQLFGKDRVVAFSHIKEGLTHPIAIENIENANKILNTELVLQKDSFMIKRFKKNLEILLKKPNPAIVRVGLCVGCRYGITENLYKLGREMEITKFVSGASYLELAPFKEELLVEGSINNDAKEGLLRYLEDYPEFDYDDNLQLILRDQDFKYKGSISKENKKKTIFNGYELYDIDNYLENNPQQIEEYVVSHLQWKRPKISWHFDCVVERIKEVFYFGLLGYSEADFKLSAMVRYGLITRDNALKQVGMVQYDLKNSYKSTVEMFKKMQLDYLINDLKSFYFNSQYLNNPD